jgi:signal transduction histidine kinase
VSTHSFWAQRFAAPATRARAGLGDTFDGVGDARDTPKLFDAWSTGAEDVVLVVDEDDRLVEANAVARAAGLPAIGAVLDGHSSLTDGLRRIAANVRTSRQAERSCVREGSRDAHWMVQATPLEGTGGKVRLVARNARSAVLLDRSVFLAGVVHELRNVAFVLRSVTETAELDGVGEGAAGEYFGHLKSPLERLFTMAAGLSRYASGPPLQRVPFTFRQLADRALGSVAPRLATAEVTCAMGELGDDTFDGDVALLSEAFSSLLAFAITASTRGSTLSLTTEHDLLDGRVSLLVTVPTSRMAMTNAELSNLWDPFGRSRGIGNGLGLALARDTLVAHGGEVVATVTPEGGLRLGLRLPAVNPHAGAAGRPER